MVGIVIISVMMNFDLLLILEKLISLLQNNPALRDNSNIYRSIN